MNLNVDVIIYRTDSQDRLTGVNSAWRHFAEYNNAPEIADGVVGRLLWDFIDGIEVEYIYRDLFERVRRKQRPISFPYRCDSPAERRDLWMEIAPLPESGLEFHSTIRIVTPFARRIDLLDPKAARLPTSLMSMCSWCKRVCVDGAWRDLEDAMRTSEVFYGEFPTITHGICNRCFSMIAIAG